MTRLVCTVRACRGELTPVGTGLACPKGHVFDRARSGYVNLLQPHDRRSQTPGDSREAVAARRRLVASGIETTIDDTLVHTVAGLGNGPGACVVDLGCGEGHLLARVARETAWDALGVDISVEAVTAAARAWPDIAWVVANVDRFVPVADRSVDVALSVTSRRPGAELERILAPGGRFVVSVPGADDLAELRGAALGRADRTGRVDRVAAGLGDGWSLVSRTEVRSGARAGRATIDDLLAVTYRGARHRERERLAGVEALDVTLHRDVLVFTRRDRG